MRMFTVRVVENAHLKKLIFAVLTSRLTDSWQIKKVLDVKVNTYTTHRHNNAGYDEVRALYTVIYEEQEE